MQIESYFQTHPRLGFGISGLSVRGLGVGSGLWAGVFLGISVPIPCCTGLKVWNMVLEYLSLHCLIT